jgi:hypothetical protein
MPDLKSSRLALIESGATATGRRAGMRGRGLRDNHRRWDDALSRVQWDELELLLAAYYRGQGWSVEHQGTGGSRARFDGGIDLKLRRGDEYVVVECKHWNSKQVPHNPVHQLIGIAQSERATGAIFVTSGEFTPHAIESANRAGNIQLVDGATLREMLGPLPERMAASAAPPSTAEAIVSVVGERLLSAAEDRIRWGRNRAIARTAGRAAAASAVAQLVLPILFLGFVYWVLTSALDGVQADLASKREAREAERIRAARAASELPSPTARTGTAAVSQVRARIGQGRASGNACHELIDWQSGTYIDHCARKRPSRQPTAAERAEQKRLADEAIRVLAPNTPELVLE